MLLLLSCFSHVRLCATPRRAAHQAPLSLGFSRQEYWSGLSFPSPMHVCMLTCFIHVRLCSNPPGSSVHRILCPQARILEWVAISFSLSIYAAAAATKSCQSCPTLCDPIDGSPPGSPIPGILQARTPEWVAISFFNAWKWKVKVKSLSHVRLCATPWTAAYQAPPSTGVSRQEYYAIYPYFRTYSLTCVPSEKAL